MSASWIEIGVLLLVALTAGVVALAAFLVWRQGYRRGWVNARSAPPVCPQCHYNLSGLTHCRCPECGTEYRLDQLWRAPIAGSKSHSSDTSSMIGSSGMTGMDAARGAANHQTDAVGLPEGIETSGASEGFTV